MDDVVLIAESPGATWPAASVEPAVSAGLRTTAGARPGRSSPLWAMIDMVDDTHAPEPWGGPHPEDLVATWLG